MAHTVCDKHNFVLGVAPGDVHDSVMFDEVYRNVLNKFPEIEMVAIDSGYKTPWIMKQVFDTGRLPAVPYKRPMTKVGFFRKYEYVYDEFYKSRTLLYGSKKSFTTGEGRYLTLGVPV